MKLTDTEKTILNGSEGLARQKAMELIVNYGIALGADRLLDTDNVLFTTRCPYPASDHADQEFETYEDMFAYANLDAGCHVEIPCVKVGHCSNHATNPNKAYMDYLGITDEKMRHGIDVTNEWLKNHGISNLLTCTPHLAGHLASKGEHIVCGESAAVIFLNSVLGARTNVEGDLVGGAASLVGKIPNSGLHLTENRRGTHLIIVDKVPKDTHEWDLMGYYIGKRIQAGVPVLQIDISYIDMDWHKSLGAALCTAGACDMYHIIGHTPEAATYELAFGGNEPKEIIHYGAAEEEIARQKLDWGTDEDVDLVLLGCPFLSQFQLRQLGTMLDGKTCKTKLIVMTSWSVRDQAARNGDIEKIEKAGGFILMDACPPMLKMWPDNVKVMATDSGKMAHYVPSTRSDMQIHMGSLDHCVQAALTGKW